jgi:hypothetical protein
VLSQASNPVALPSARPTAEAQTLLAATTVGEVYLAITAAAESLTSSALDQIRSQLAKHLAVSEAIIKLNMLSGSVILQVTLSGERVDGARLAQQLETDVTAGRLSNVVVGYVPPNSHASCPEKVVANTVNLSAHFMQSNTLRHLSIVEANAFTECLLIGAAVGFPKSGNFADCCC